MKPDAHTALLYGKNPLKEIENYAKREGLLLSQVVSSLMLTKEAREDRDLSSLIDKHKLNVSVVTREEIESRTGRGVNHQGVCALIHEDHLYTSYEKLMSSLKDGEKTLFVLLDELEDPHNVGAIIRSAAAFGARAIFIPEHRAVQITDTVIKTSSGMNFAIPIVRIGNVNTCIEKLKSERFWVYGLAMKGSSSLTTTTYDEKTLLVIGSEGKGMREKTEELCDFTLSIPMDQRCESLNASVAASLALYEWKRQSAL